jgi:hypothetical protein
LAGPHRQQRLSPVERLDLGFFIDAQHHGASRRIEVEPDVVAHLLDEQPIARNRRPYSKESLSRVQSQQYSPLLWKLYMPDIGNFRPALRSMRTNV